MTRGAHRARSLNADKLITAERLPAHSERRHGTAATRRRKAIYRWWVSDPSPLRNRLSHTLARTLALTRRVLNRQSEKHAITGRKCATQAIFGCTLFRAPENKQINRQTNACWTAPGFENEKVNEMFEIFQTFLLCQLVCGKGFCQSRLTLTGL